MAAVKIKVAGDQEHRQVDRPMLRAGQRGQDGGTQAEPGDRQHALDSDLQIRGRQRAIVPAARVQNPGLQILASVPLDLDTGRPVASRRGRVMS